MAIPVKLKKAILKLIPYTIVRFTIKYININFLYFGTAKKNTGEYLLRDCKNAFTCYDMEDALGPEVVDGFKKRFEDYKKHEGFLCEYILTCTDCIIEPVYGWGITAKNELIFDSISNNSWIETYHPAWVAYKKNKNKAVYYPEIISIRLIKGGEKNYWHFLHDLLGQVALARQNKIDAPILISKAFSERGFFKMALQKSAVLASAKWIIQDKQYIKAGKAYFLQTKPNSMKQFFGVLDLLEVANSDKETKRKIFLTRNKSRIRFLNNSSRIEKIAQQYGFEIIDADTLSFPEQIQLFGETAYLIGIHGAGLTNVIFRLNAPLTVFELLPKDYIEPHYFWLAKGMGHKYLCQVGTKSGLDSSFEVDEKEFENNIQIMNKL